MSSSTAVPPPISWAQRNHLLYVIVNVECKDVDHKFTEESMYFKGRGVTDNKEYEVKLNFLDKINPDKVTSKNICRCLEFTIEKKGIGSYWPTLTTDKKKPHFLSVDFNKWIDENSDNEDEYLGGGDPGADSKELQQLMNMKLLNEKPDVIGSDEEEDSDDEEEIPDLEA